ncbi:MAG: hypothetical protein AB1529_08450 [Candidatus Micrarchaeota archaeon]
MIYLEPLAAVLGQWRYRTAFLALLVILLPLLSVSSSTIIPWTLELNPTAEAPKIAIMGAVASLMALNGAVLLHNYEAMKAAGGTTALGTLAALFTSACPVCQPIWLVWLGLGSATAFLADIGLYMGLLSLGLLVFSLHNSLKAASGTCEVR